MAMCVLVSKNNRWAVKVGMLFGTSLPNNKKSMACRQKKMCKWHGEKIPFSSTFYWRGKGTQGNRNLIGNLISPVAKRILFIYVIFQEMQPSLFIQHAGFPFMVISPGYFPKRITKNLLRCHLCLQCRLVRHVKPWEIHMGDDNLQSEL